MTVHSVLAQRIIIYRVVLSHSDDGRDPLLPANNAPDAEQDEGTVYIFYIMILHILWYVVLYVHMIDPFSFKCNHFFVWHFMCAARVRLERVCKTVAVTENDDKLWSCAH